MSIKRLSIVALLLMLVAASLGVMNAKAAALCSPATAITGPFAKDGTGDLCWQTTSLCSYINSWNLTTLEVNGTTYTNLYVAGSSITPLNGTYTIHYVSPVAWGHFEIGGPCSGVGPTNTPTRTNVPGATPTRTNTLPAVTATRTVGASPTRTATPVVGATATATRTRTATPTPTNTVGASATRTATQGAGMTGTPTQIVGASPTRVPTPPTLTVRVFWLIPSDVAYDQKIYDGMVNVMREAQRYYQQELGKTFTLNNPVVEVVAGDHPANWYETNQIGGPNNSHWWTTQNMQAELMRKYNLSAPDPRWKIVGYISAVGNGGGGSNWVILPKHDADGAGGYGGAMGRWYGGMVHELGHAFGLPDSTATDGTPMSASFYDYPNCHFSAAQKNSLLTLAQNNGFLK